MSDVLNRFLRYVQVDTQSADEHCDQVPSTAIQFDLANMLADELRNLGARDVTVSENAYVTAWIPASEGAEDRPRLGLISHLDTTEQAPGFGVKPHVMTYEGGDLVCAMVDGKAISISPALLPALNDLVGEELVCTDGTTLLGADDKAGIAEIMALAGEDSPLALRRALANSRMLSSDVSAGFDHLYADHFEKKNAAVMGHGLCFNKYTGSRGKGGSNDADAEYFAQIRDIMDEAGVDYQTCELGRIGAGGGGTIAYILAEYGMDVIDSGVAVISMHALWEVANKADIYEAYKGYKAFIERP